MLPQIQRFDTATGLRIYRIPCEAFPDLVAYVYLLLGGDRVTLIDTGSGYGASNAHVLSGVERVKADFGEPVALSDIRRIIITHGHIDHFGGLSHLRQHLQAEVAIHELDRRILTAYEERVVLATKALRHYLAQAGVRPGLQAAFMELYGFSKRHVRNLPVDIVLTDGQELDGLRFIHTPGHCPGQVCVAADNILLSADHILPVTTPHLAPESITQYTGLGHYLESLAKVRALTGFDLALGGHEGPIRNLPQRIDEIHASHIRKLDKIVDILRQAEQPLTIDEISQRLYTRVQGFHVLLALEETGAHVEYLDQHGRLAVANLEEVEREENPAIRYTLVDGEPAQNQGGPPT